MSGWSTIILLPFLAAVLVYLGLFYSRNSAVIAGSWNFIGACAAGLGLVSYLVLRVGSLLSFATTIVYAVVGALLLLGALVSLWR